MQFVAQLVLVGVVQRVVAQLVLVGLDEVVVALSIRFFSFVLSFRFFLFSF